MANPTITNYGVIPYVNNTNNWRAEDVAFISKRTVLRFKTQADLTGSTHNEIGALAYVADDPNNDDVVEPGANAKLTVRLSGTAWKTLITSEYLTVPSAHDQSTQVVLRHSGAASGGVSLKSDGSTAFSSPVTVGTSVSLDPAYGVTITAAGVSARLLPISSGLTIDKPVSITGGVTATGSVSSGASVSAVGAVTAGTSISAATGSISGILNSGSLAVSGSASVGTTLSVTGTTTVGGVGSLSSSGGTFSIGKSGTPTKLDIKTSTIEFSTSGGVWNNGTAGQTSALVASVVTSTIAPTSSHNYPEGTIWFKI